MMSYADLERHYGRLGRLGEATELLQWDNMVMMPGGGAESRAEQLAALHVLAHQLAVDARLGPLIEAAETDDTLDEWQRANLREMRRAWRHATAVPEDLVEAISRASSRCEAAWREARPANDFARISPLLQEVVALVRQKAAAKADALGVDAYDALLDEFEPDGRSAEIDRLFDEIAAFLPDLVERVLEHQARQAPPERPLGPFPVEQQRRLGLRFMETLGFDFQHGRLDVSLHPFCGGTPDDVRITTRYAEHDFAKGLMGVLHETGHALYERGLPARWRAQPVGSSRSMGIHESQSLLMEMQACRSREFLRHAAPIIRSTFGRDGDAFAADNLYRLFTRVARSLIRVDADECTYPLHVILRYRLERKLLSGDLRVADLPEAWRASMQDLLGVVPPDDRDGCLQDIHWMEGILGYFPTYTLGALTAAQLFAAAILADGDIRPGIARGDFSPLLHWLRDNVHQWGCRYSSTELVTRATGRPLDVAVFRAHLERRYLDQAEEG